MDSTIETSIENFVSTETSTLVTKVCPTWFSAATQAQITALLQSNVGLIFSILADYSAHRTATAAAAAAAAAKPSAV